MPAAQGTHTASNYVLVAEPLLGLETVRLRNGQWTIGAAVTNRVVIAAPGIADEHCLILSQDGHLQLTPHNGQTRVNGILTSGVTLHAGDVLTLGEADFQIRLEPVHQEPATTGDGDTPHGTSSSDRIEALTHLTDELEREFTGRQSRSQQLETALEQIQTGLETESKTQDSESGTEGSEIPRPQNTLDQIAQHPGQEQPAFSPSGVEQQLSIQIEQQLRHLESYSRSLQSRAELLEQQAIELDMQRSRLDSLETRARQNSDIPENISSPSGIREASASPVSDAGPILSQSESWLQQQTPQHADSLETDLSFTGDDAASMEVNLNSYLDNQRRKLRALMEEFQPCEADETESDFSNQVEHYQSFADETDHLKNREAVMAAHNHSSSMIGTEHPGDRNLQQPNISSDSGHSHGGGGFQPSKPSESVRTGDGITLTDSEFNAISAAHVSGSETSNDSGTAHDPAHAEHFSADADQQATERSDDRQPVTSSARAAFDFSTEQLTAVADADHIENDADPVEIESQTAATGLSPQHPDNNTVGDNSEQAASPSHPEDVTPSDNGPQAPETNTHELRNQLAQMFDIQDPETPAAETQQISDELDQPGVNADSEEQPSDFQNQFELPHDAEQNSQASTSAADAPAEATTEWDTENADEIYSETELTNREAIREYMDALLARNRRQLAGDEEDEPAPDESSSPPAAPDNVSGEQASQDSVGTEIQNDEEQNNRAWLTEGPKHSQDRVALRASMATLREVANETARSAVAQASQTQLRQEILTLAAASLICLGFAVAATLLMNNPLMPLGSVGLGLYFAVRMGLLMRCSWGISRHVRKTSDKSSA